MARLVNLPQSQQVEPRRMTHRELFCLPYSSPCIKEKLDKISPLYKENWVSVKLDTLAGQYM